jgi:hypothetical protein
VTSGGRGQVGGRGYVGGEGDKGGSAKGGVIGPADVQGRCTGPAER